MKDAKTKAMLELKNPMGWSIEEGSLLHEQLIMFWNRSRDAALKEAEESSNETLRDDSYRIADEVYRRNNAPSARWAAARAIYEYHKELFKRLREVK